MSEAARERWNSRYRAGWDQPVPPPDPGLIQLVRNQAPGQALELACGLGQNAIWLASQGWTVTAVDLSDIGLGRAQEQAAAAHLQVDWIQADLDHWQPPDNLQYDLILVQRFLDRGATR